MSLSIQTASQPLAFTPLAATPKASFTAPTQSRRIDIDDSVSLSSAAQAALSKGFVSSSVTANDDYNPGRVAR